MFITFFEHDTSSIVIHLWVLEYVLKTLTLPRQLKEKKKAASLAIEFGAKH